MIDKLKYFPEMCKTIKTCVMFSLLMQKYDLDKQQPAVGGPLYYSLMMYGSC